MQNLMNDLTKLFQKDDRIFAAGTLLKNKLTELALKFDQKLIDLLLSDKKAREHFFTEKAVKKEKVLVFDKDKFISFVNNKEFLPDSFTSFKNKIGLMDNGDYLKEKSDVVLAWAYKDCVLEGGQDKEDQKRNEIFYNETLAPDEIDRLFEPKVLTNLKRNDKKGEHKLTGFSPDDNLIIKGNNLLALHCLKQKYRGKVKLIYIDPPFNTGNDEFKYNDRFNHSTWLTFMKNRLEAARELLRQDGVIFVHCDDNEHAYLKVLMDGIFGRHNFINTIAVKMSTASGVKTSHREKAILKEKEYLLVYAKQKELVRFVPQYIPEPVWDDEYQFVLEKNNSQNPDDWKIYKLSDVLKQNGIPYDPSDQRFQKFVLKNKTKIWRRAFIRSKYKKISQEQPNKIFCVSGSNGEHCYYRGREMYFLKNKIKDCFTEDGDISTYGNLIGDWWSDINTGKLFSEGGVELRAGKKPEFLMARIIRLVTKDNDLVLDYHIGTGTTCAVAHKMNRQYIGIEQLDYGPNDSVVRLKGVINGDKTGMSKAVAWKGGGSFIYMELKKWNEEYMAVIQEADTTQKLLNIYKKMKEEAFFRYDIDLSKFDEKEFKKLLLEEQQQVLCECLDKNHLYVNLSEIDDATYKISAEDKGLNKQFYKPVF